MALKRQDESGRYICVARSHVLIESTFPTLFPLYSTSLWPLHDIRWSVVLLAYQRLMIRKTLVNGLSTVFPAHAIYHPSLPDTYHSSTNIYVLYIHTLTLLTITISPKKKCSRQAQKAISDTYHRRKPLPQIIHMLSWTN